MKNIHITFTIILLFLFISCGKEYLETYSYTDVDIENFYKTPENAFAGLAAAYDPIRWNYFNHIILITEVASDNCFGGGGVTDDNRLLVWDNFNGNLYPNPHEDPWIKYYTGIYRVNILLQNIDNVEWGETPELKNRYTAEAKFLRAYYYFDLVRLFGHVPLLTAVLDVDNLDVSQEDPHLVYRQIAEDLLYGVENLPSVPYQEIPIEVEGGRVTKWAAEALLARVFLYYTGYFNQSSIQLSDGQLTRAQARSFIDDAINNSGHDLVSNYAHLWKQSGSNFIGEDNIETVFGIKYTHMGYDNEDIRTLGNNWQVMISPRNQGYGTLGNGWGGGPVNPQLYHEYEEGDTRRDATIVAWDYEGYNYDRSDQKQYTGFGWRKFVPLIVNGTHSTTALGGSYIYDNPDDKPEIRFSDVLLMGAELHLDGGDPGLAQQYFDRVRDRAFQDQSHRLSVTIENIMEERRWEFALEGQRYFDLLRQGLDVAKAAIDFNSLNIYYDSVWINPRYSGNVSVIETINFRLETQGLFGIPEPQIELSKGFLIQNVGWE